jgi:hypothetical protein
VITPTTLVSFGRATIWSLAARRPSFAALNPRASVAATEEKNALTDATTLPIISPALAVRFLAVLPKAATVSALELYKDPQNVGFVVTGDNGVIGNLLKWVFLYVTRTWSSLC